MLGCMELIVRSRPFKSTVGSQIPIEKCIDWQEPHKDPNLFGDVVHVWYGSFQHALNIYKLIELLSPQEQHRAKRFVFDIDRERFIARRVILRLILSVYVGIAPSKIAIKTNAYGKPEIKSENNACTFSLSYSKDRIVYAISKNRRLGIDIEHTEELETESVLTTLFPPKTIESLKDQGRADHINFYDLWTSLEAYLKAIGTGFAQTVGDEFWKNFPIDLRTRRKKDPNWSIVQFVPEPGLFGTLMINAPETEVVFLNFSNILDLEPDSRIPFSGE